MTAEMQRYTPHRLGITALAGTCAVGGLQVAYKSLLGVRRFKGQMHCSRKAKYTQVVHDTQAGSTYQARSAVLCLHLQPIGPNTLLGELVDSNQRAVLVFYDEWTTPTGHTVGGKV